jgi:thioesterase domain-containing protein
MTTKPISDSFASWVVPLRAAGTRPPLFCACAGGGDPLDYRDLALALPDDQPVYAFGLPPLAEGAAFPTVTQLAATYADAVRRLQPYGPYNLCGHSFGGLVVYEIAALLIGAGEPVGVVALLDTLHPSYKRHLSRQDRLIFLTLYLADRLAKYARSLGQGRPDRALRDAVFFVAGRAKRIYWQLVRVVFRRLGQSPPTLISSKALVLAAAWHSYEARDHDVPLVLFNAVDRPAEFRRDKTLGWQACVSRPFEVHLVPGDHYSLLHPPHVQALAGRLAQYLEVSLDSDGASPTAAA